MAGNTTTTATARTEAEQRASVNEALGHIDRVRCFLALLDDVTDDADGISLTSDAMLGFKQAMIDARDRLLAAREALERIAYAPPKLDRARAGAD